MRKKKEKQVEKRYYRPTKKRCPNCKSKLKRSYKLWHKYLETLEGRYYVVSHGYRCQNENCLQQEVVYRSQEAEELGVPECGYGLDVIVEIGYQRFWHQRRVAEIHKGLKERITISERQVLNLIGTFLALLRAGQPAKVVNQQKKWKRLGGLILSIDGMQPEKGSPALYVVREVQLDITLMAEVLESGTHKTLVSALLEPINEWEIPIKGIISDAQENIQLAVAQVWPNCPHQTCQFHCIKEAGRLTYALDRTMKTQLKKKLRGFLNRVYKTVRELAETDPYKAVLLQYTRYLRFTLLTRGLAPFELGGLQMVQQLITIEASLLRAQEKGHPLLTRLIKIAGFHRFCTVQANRLRRQLGWLVALQRLLSPDSQADDQVQVTAHSVASAVDQYLVALTQDTTLDDADRSIVQHINTTFRNRWWGLFVCYDVSGLPSTNNALEGFFGRLKTNQRLITGRKSVNNFVLRYGSFAAFVDPTETKDELLFRLRSVDRSAYLFERQRLHSILAERKDYFRFCHHLDSVVSELEIAWESALLSNTNRHDSDSPSNST